MILELNDLTPLKNIFNNEFDSVPPDPGQGSVLAVVEDGQIEAFVMVELLVRAGLLWVAPEHRNTPKAARLVKELMRYVYINIPDGTSAITIDSDGEFGRLFKKLGMYPLEGTLYRKDF